MYNPRFLNEGAELLDDYFDTPSESNHEQDNQEEIEVQKPRRIRYKDFYKPSKSKIDKTMAEEDIITNLKKNRRQARQLCPNAMVVSWEQAKKAIHKAYQEGANSGVETTVAATQKTVCYDKENISEDYSSSECRAAETFIRDSRQ